MGDNPLKTQKNKNFEKMKKITGDIILLHMCTKNHNCMRFLGYGVRQTDFFVVLGHFLPFYPLTIWKIKFRKSEKIIWGCHHFTNVYQKSRSYDVYMLPEIWSATDINFCHLGPFFPFLQKTCQE